MSRAIIVGSGFGGLALGIRLQSAGVETVIVEARDKHGGHAYSWEQGGFTLDDRPSVSSYLDSLCALWVLSGRAHADDFAPGTGSRFYPLHLIHASRQVG